MVNIGKEENVTEELARMRGQATSRKLFNSLSQPSPSYLRQMSQPSLSLPSLPPNPLTTRRIERLAESDNRHMQRPLDDPNTPLIIALQASISKSQNLPTDNMNMIILNILQKMQGNQEASNKRNIDMLEQHQLDMEL